jgi:hypothetical protein
LGLFGDLFVLRPRHSPLLLFTHLISKRKERFQSWRSKDAEKEQFGELIWDSSLFIFVVEAQSFEMVSEFQHVACYLFA